MLRNIDYQLAAPEVDNYISMLDRHATIINENTIKLIKELFIELRKIKPCGRHNRRELYLEVPKGTIEDYGDYEELKEYGDVESYEEFEKWWQEDYPDDFYWYHLESVEDEGYMAIILKNRLILEVKSYRTNEDYDRFEDQIDPFIKWLIATVKNGIKQIQDGTYNEYVNKHLSFENRTGTIIRNDYWKAYPQLKEEYFKDFPKADYDEFILLMGKYGETYQPDGRLETMTSGLFFHCCALGYAANHYKGCDLPAKQQYLKHADGRDDGLTKIDENSAEAFEIWYNDDKHYGGHPWEVCMGGNSTHVDLYVVKDEKGYYFHVAGKSRTRSVEAAHFYLAIYNAGYPVTISHGKEMANRFLGIDKIGIVPAGVIPCYCESYFPNEQILDFMNLDSEDKEKLLPYITWQDIPKQNLL